MRPRTISQDLTRGQKRITTGKPRSKPGILGSRHIFFVSNNKNGRHDFRYRSPARVPVPELRGGRLRLRQRRGVDGRCPLDHLPGGAGGQERWPVLHPVRSVHHPAGHRGVHGDQGSGREREDQRPPAASVRRDPCLDFILKLKNQGGFPKTPTNQFTFEIQLVVVD